jgi:hypothetical protein
MDEELRDYILKKLGNFIMEMAGVNSIDYLNGGIYVEMSDGQNGTIGWKEDLM